MEGTSSVSGNSRKRGAEFPIVNAITAMTLLSNFRPSQEDALPTLNNGGGSYNDDFDDVQDESENIHPDFMRLLNEMKNSKPQSNSEQGNHNVDVGVHAARQGESNVPKKMSLDLWPLLQKYSSMMMILKLNLVQNPNKIKSASSSSNNKINDAQSGPSKISPPPLAKNGFVDEVKPSATKESNNERTRVTKSKKGEEDNDNSILHQILSEQKYLPAPLSPIRDQPKHVKFETSKKGKELVNKTAIKKSGIKKVTVNRKLSSSNSLEQAVRPEIRTSTPVVNRNDSDSEPEIFSQAEDRNILSSFVKLYTKVKREAVEKKAAREGDARLANLALVMIKRGNELLRQIENRRITEERATKKLRYIEKMLHN